MADDELTEAAVEAKPVRVLMDPRRSNFISLFGKKGSGKSTLARRLFDAYPFDRAVID
jgi:ABC-type polysaccharide/polyol phosphate transport system ATPase subunit